MTFFKNTKGTIDSSYTIGNITLRDDIESLSIINASSSLYIPLKGGSIPSSSSYDNLPNVLDLYGLIPLIEFSFQGNNPPATGSYLNKFGICYETGGEDYTSSAVYFDKGNEFLKVSTIKHIVTSVEVKQGGLDLDENTIYSLQDGEWVPKGSAGKGTPQFIYVPYSYQDIIIKSSSSVPFNAWILNTSNKIEEPFNGTGANLEIYISGSTINTTLMESTVSDLLTNNQYEVEDLIKVVEGGFITVNVFSGEATNGSGSILVSYVIPRT